MKNKSLPIMLAIIGIICIFSGIFLTIYKNITDENKKNRKEKELIINNYNLFKSARTSFEQSRDEYFDKIVNNLTVDNIEQYNDWIKVLDKYTESINMIEQNSKILKDKCINNEYKDIDLKNNCEAFIIAYETNINYYTKDIIYFNDIIDKINNDNDKELEKYELKYEYVDINDDGKYYGKD